MPSLTHVCHWTKHGWKRITAEEAAREYPEGTVSARSGLFMCELCNQYVTLTKPGKNQRHFRHEQDGADGVCPDKRRGENVNIAYSPRDYELPIRITNIGKNSFMLELGLLPVPEDILAEQSSQKIVVCGEGASNQTYLVERLRVDEITYLPIGNVPATSYSVEAGEILKRFWPQKVTGVSCIGTLFEKSSGKMLIENADVQVDRAYYLLCLGTMACPEDIEIKGICEERTGNGYWKVYEIKAQALSENAARFFWDMKYRLTDSPLSIQPIWPVYVEKSYMIQHNETNLILYVNGNEELTVKTLPPVHIKQKPFPESKGRMFDIPCNDRQQLFTVGRTKVLQYLCFWRKALDGIAAQPQVKVTDIDSKEILSGICNSLPKERTLCITAPFDGMIMVRGKDAVIVEQERIQAENCSKLYNLQMGYLVTVYQGLDAVWSITFEKQIKAVVSNMDEQVSRRLESYHGEMMPAAHSLGGVTAKLDKYPRVRQWLYKKIQQGEIPIAAYRYFRDFISSR